MSYWSVALMTCITFSLAGCAPPKEPLMATCRASMTHGDPRWSPIEKFEICMSTKDYHLTWTKKCMARDSLTDPVSPSPNAIREPDCWFRASSNWP